VSFGLPSRAASGVIISRFRTPKKITARSSAYQNAPMIVTAAVHVSCSRDDGAR
jgi:hypothetical protein